ncbi:MAG TPA: sugar ABC transporter ATP-binding protein, partial [Opitutaceae bacterium]|nr:sugar ABC transporter ATP-binding protein [Opitutaceae bacterium]
MSIPPRLTVRSVGKSFGTNAVLRELDLTIEPGEIHALVGGNGAGKSTLSKIIAGIEQANAGELLLDGVPHTPSDRRAAQSAGVVMVMQEPGILPTLTVAENLFLGELPSRLGGRIDRSRLRAISRAALARVGLESLHPDTPAAQLGVGRQQLVEIAAGLARDCRLLILDEPTAALTNAEIGPVFALLRKLRAQGVSILYISHRLDEIRLIADRVSVLRDGRLAATLPVAGAPRAKLIELMAGAALEQAHATNSTNCCGEQVLRIRNLRSGRAVRDVSLDVHAGEIVGLGGLVGAGRTELLRAIFGAERVDGGEVFLGDEKEPFVARSTHAAVACGFAFVPEDRGRDGIFASLSVRMNAGVARLPLRSGAPGWVDHRVEIEETDALLSRLQVRYADADQPCSQLSGGNQQKIVIGRWLRRDARVWLLDEPTRGVDVAARR